MKALINIIFHFQIIRFKNSIWKTCIYLFFVFFFILFSTFDQVLHQVLAVCCLKSPSPWSISPRWTLIFVLQHKQDVKLHVMSPKWKGQRYRCESCEYVQAARTCSDEQCLMSSGAFRWNEKVRGCTNAYKLTVYCDNMWCCHSKLTHQFSQVVMYFN